MCKHLFSKVEGNNESNSPNSVEHGSSWEKKTLDFGRAVCSPMKLPWLLWFQPHEFFHHKPPGLTQNNLHLQPGKKAAHLPGSYNPQSKAISKTLATIAYLPPTLLRHYIHITHHQISSPLSGLSLEIMGFGAPLRGFKIPHLKDTSLPPCPAS